jgi:hypothetical protein
MVVATESPDPTGVLFPNNPHCLFQVDSLARHLLQLAYNTNGLTGFTMFFSHYLTNGTI